MPDRTVNLLLISDNEEDVMNVQQAFKQNNIHNPLYVVADELKALAMLRGNSTALTFPSYRRLVLLDLNAASMSGMRFLRQLRADPDLKMTPVVILAATNQDSLKGEAYSLNAAGYILKPITASKFAEAMATLNTYWTLSEMP